MALIAENPFVFLNPWKDASADKNAGFNNVSDFLGVGLNIVFGTAIAISMIALILSGIKFITLTKSDPKEKAATQQALTYSVLAFILAIAAYTIKTIIIHVVGGDFKDLANGTPNF